MGHLLHAIGAFAARRRWTVIGAWVMMIVVVGAAAAAFQDAANGLVQHSGHAVNCDP